MKKLYVTNIYSNKHKNRITSYRGRETLEAQVNSYSHFLSKDYIVHKKRVQGKKYVMYRLTCFDVIDKHHNNVNISHVVVDIKCLASQDAKIMEMFEAMAPLEFKAKVVKYEKHVSRTRQEFDLFRRLDDFNNGRKLRETKPKATYGLTSATLNLDTKTIKESGNHVSNNKK